MKKLPVGLTLVFYLAACNLGFVSSLPVDDSTMVLQISSSQSSSVKKNPSAQQSIQDVTHEATYAPARFFDDNHLYA